MICTSFNRETLYNARDARDAKVLISLESFFSVFSVFSVYFDIVIKPVAFDILPAEVQRSL